MLQLVVRRKAGGKKSQGKGSQSEVMLGHRKASFSLRGYGGA